MSEPPTPELRERMLAQARRHLRLARAAEWFVALMAALSVTYGVFLAAHWEVVVHDCAALDAPPEALRVELRGCFVDLADVVVYEKRGRTDAVYAPLRAPDGFAPAHVVARLEDRAVRAWAEEGGDLDAVPSSWVGPRTFRGVRRAWYLRLSGPRHSRITRHLQTVAPEIALVELGPSADLDLFFPFSMPLVLTVVALAIRYNERRGWRRQLRDAGAR